MSEWQPLTRRPRTLIVVCHQCKRGVVNEWNQLHRARWQELGVGRPGLYRCGRCAERSAEVAT